MSDLSPQTKMVIFLTKLLLGIQKLNYKVT